MLDLLGRRRKMKKFGFVFTLAFVASLASGGCAKQEREAVCVCAEDYGADWDDCNRILKENAKSESGCDVAIKEAADCVEFTGCADKNCNDEWKDIDSKCNVAIFKYCIKPFQDDTMEESDAGISKCTSDAV
jgi:hypothetical protein